MYTRQNKIRILFLIISLNLITGCWVKQNSGVNNDIYSVHFINHSEGWAVGNGIVLKTKNGGNDWIKINSPDNISFFTSVFFIDSNTGWLSGAGGIYKTTDGGESWIKKLDVIPWASYKSLYFLNPYKGYVVEQFWFFSNSYSILTTDDGGEHWKSLLNKRSSMLRPEDSYLSSV